jgi:hypothetical protein
VQAKVVLQRTTETSQMQISEEGYREKNKKKRNNSSCEIQTMKNDTASRSQQAANKLQPEIFRVIENNKQTRRNTPICPNTPRRAAGVAALKQGRQVQRSVCC